MSGLTSCLSTLQPPRDGIVSKEQISGAPISLLFEMGTSAFIRVYCTAWIPGPTQLCMSQPGERERDVSWPRVDEAGPEGHLWERKQALIC